MAKFNGSLQKLIFTGTPDKECADTRDISLNISTNMIDVTTRDSNGWAEYLGGLRSYTGKVTGIVNYTTQSGKARMGELIAYGISRTPVAFVMSTEVEGDTSFTGNGIFSNVQWATPHEGESTWTADLQGTGPIVPAVIVEE